jgi:hypothetical protein
VKKWLLELADAALAHRNPTVEFATDKDVAAPGGERIWPLLWASYRWTGDEKYLRPMRDAGPRGLATNPSGAWQGSDDTGYLERLYTDQIAAAAVREYINTEGSLWTDRVNVPDAELQRARLGGIALVRNSIYPGHVVSWTFDADGDDERVAILVRDATPRRVRIVAHNLTGAAIGGRMTTWDVAPGEWKIVQDGRARNVELERSADVDVTVPPGETAIDLELVKEGVPYWTRPDVGISARDVRVTGRDVAVTVHSLGAVDAPASRVVVRARDGREIASASVGALQAPIDLRPRTATVHVRLPAGADLAGGTVAVETASAREITLRNNTVRQ